MNIRTNRWRRAAQNNAVVFSTSLLFGFIDFVPFYSASFSESKSRTTMPDVATKTDLENTKTLTVGCIRRPLRVTLVNLLLRCPMWTADNRGTTATNCVSEDLTDAGMGAYRPLIPPGKPASANRYPRGDQRRKMILSTGCQWRALQGFAAQKQPCMITSACGTGTARWSHPSCALPQVPRKGPKPTACIIPTVRV